MIKRNIFKCVDEEMLKQVQHDGKKGSHPEFISGSLENKEMLKQVQHDGKNDCHPELDSGSQESKQMPSPVQYDGYSTGRMPNPVQYNGWRRASLSLGRSMIEMLGVLAIIGVLSIGGLYAYRQAMERYRINEMVNYINHMTLIFSENPDAFEGDTPNAAGASHNAELLCSSMGNQNCKVEYFYLTFPSIPSARLKFIHAEPIMGKKVGIFIFSNISPQMCAHIIQLPLLMYRAQLSSGAPIIRQTGLLKTDKEAIATQCLENDERKELTFYFVSGF